MGEGSPGEACLQPLALQTTSGGPQPLLPVSRTAGPLQKGDPGPEVGARPLGHSPTKQRALTDSSTSWAVLGRWGVIDRSLQPSPDL